MIFQRNIAVYTSYESLLKNPYSIKDNAYGLDLVAWWVAPQLLKKYGFQKRGNDEKENSFQKFLLTKSKIKNIYPGYQSFQRSDSQETIGELESKNRGSHYLASILDVTPAHLYQLENIKKTCLIHLEKSYGVQPKNDCYRILYPFSIS